MEPCTIPSTPEEFAGLLHELRLGRRQRKESLRADNRVRQSLSAAERSAIFTKTGGRCHICGGTIHGAWQADHVFPHSGGGAHAADTTCRLTHSATITAGITLQRSSSKFSSWASGFAHRLSVAQLLDAQRQRHFLHTSVLVKVGALLLILLRHLHAKTATPNTALHSPTTGEYVY